MPFKARLYEIFLAHRVHAAFIVRILNTRPAIGDQRIAAIAFHPRLRNQTA
jgi:hypothetical protein